MIRICCFVMVVFILISAASAQETIPPKGVFIEKGNIVFYDGTKKIQLTKKGIDRAPVLSPNRNKIVFLRKSREEAYDPVGGGEDSGPGLADQVWVIDISGNNEKMIVQDYNPDAKVGYNEWKGEDVVGYILDDSLQFSLDGKTVYYLTPAWVTSSALRTVNIDGSNDHFIAAANTLKVIDKGQYKGNLIISQHRYFMTGGSYDWFYVFNPDGKEIGVLGEDLDAVDWDFLYSDAL